MALFGRQNAPVTKPAHSPPNNRLDHPSIAYEEKPLSIGIVKLGMIPKIVVQNNSLRIFVAKFALSGTLGVSPGLLGETTNLKPTFGSGLSPGVATCAYTPTREGCADCDTQCPDFGPIISPTLGLPSSDAPRWFPVASSANSSVQPQGNLITDSAAFHSA